MQSQERLPRFVLALFALLSMVVGSVSAARAVESELDPDCALAGSLSPEISRRLDEALLEIDAQESTMVMVGAHVDLIRNLGARTNYCDIERRLRRLNARTFLVALPPRAIVGASRKYTLIYAWERFQSWSQIPRYGVWYERRGAEVAARRREEVGLSPALNLRDLDQTGVLAPAENIHKQFLERPTPDTSGLDTRYVRLREIIDDYRARSFLSDDYNPTLMHIIDNYVRNRSDLRYTINSEFSAGTLQFFVVDQDPDRIVSRMPCNCVFYPQSNFVICDKRLLRAILGWVSYGRGDQGAPAFLRTMNDGIADLLLHWLIGHEIGHYVLRHALGGSFLPPESPVTPLELAEPVSIREAEIAADRFALSTLPPNVQAAAHMGTNYIIQQLVARVRKVSRQSGDGDEIRVRESGQGHPNFLTRVFGMMEGLGVVDFLLEGFKREMVLDPARGANLPSVCVLSQE